MNDNDNYIMAKNAFQNLSFIRGFNNMNGNSYQEHITIIFEDRLTQEQKDEILSENDSDKALCMLKSYGINYTHDYYYE